MCICENSNMACKGLTASGLDNVEENLGVGLYAKRTREAAGVAMEKAASGCLP